jgi:prepilin-type N-terminal cleavage/methylation domain-containing protein
MNTERQRGFTLIELMVALVVSSLLVGMILAIFSRMSLAYRGQQQIAGVQQVLAAARATIETDAKQTGFGMAQGFKIATDAPRLHWPVQITDSSTGPDKVAFFYADPSAQSVVTVAAVQANWQAIPSVVVDTTAGFAPNDLVVLTKVDTSTNTPIAGEAGIEANIATYDACVMQLVPTAVGATTLTFSTQPPWGIPSSSQCTLPTVGTVIYKFVARGYRIDPNAAKATLGALQQSPTGGLFKSEALDGWADVAYGFTDIQTALQVYDGDGNDSADLDTDPLREWYSDAQQDTQTGTGVPPPPAAPSAPLQISISLVARTDRDVEGITTSATPNLTAAPNLGNNTVGNRASVPLPSATDPALQGSRIYRYLTFQVDFRNTGIGR